MTDIPWLNKIVYASIGGGPLIYRLLDVVEAAEQMVKQPVLNNCRELASALEALKVEAKVFDKGKTSEKSPPEDCSL